ncbi:hypothetical protein ACLI1A_00720 [Flavobacterium sp. RHBU_3]|uniref:hypothetical protein n=1 Tax=Flavobacterium sp. RHBU_3 TaxID=3391184 RepID=UPI003984ECC4
MPLHTELIFIFGTRDAGLITNLFAVMETFSEIISWYCLIIRDNLFLGLLTAKLCSYIFDKEVYATSKEFIRKLILLSGVIGIAFAIAGMFSEDSVYFINRATGPYALVYWLSIFFSCILPFTVLLKKLRKSGKAIFVVAVLMNTGRIMERFVIIVSSLHRDYLPSSWSMYEPFAPVVTSLMRGMLAGLIITGISITALKFKKNGYD